MIERAAALVRGARRPMIVSGGGTIYSEATEALGRLAEQTGIPVAETQAGKGSMPYDHPLALGAVGATGTFAANRAAREADLVIGVGTRWSDFTTASKTAFQNPDVRFVNINIADFDAHKHAGLALVGDARATLEALDGALPDYEVEGEYREQSGRANGEWDREVERLYAPGSRAAPGPERGHRGGQLVLRAGGRGRMRGRIDAWGPAQTLEDSRPQRLPRRVRLLDDGLRDRRGPGRQDGRSRPARST